MKLVLFPVLVALIAQFGSLPMLIGARGAGEAIGWPMIMAIFFGIPSFVIYLIMFATMRAIMPPPWLAIAIGVAIPAAIVIAFFHYRGTPLDVSLKNWVLWMGMIGGLGGAITHIYLRSGTATAI